MAKKITYRQYSKADADLVKKGDRLLQNAQKDGQVFATRGFTAQRLLAINTVLHQFKNSSTDAEFAGEVMHCVIKRNEAVTAVLKAIYAIKNIAWLAFDGVGYYHSFKFINISQLPPESLHRAARRVARLATQLQSQLSVAGLLPLHIMQLQLASTAMEQAITDVEVAKEARLFEKIDRIALGNALWAEVQGIAKVGKHLFENNPARYNDYFLIK